MKKNIATTALIALGAFAACGTASAESMRVEVPFAFQTAGATLPAGKYVVHVKPGSPIVELTPADGRTVYLSTAPSSTRGVRAGAGSITFRQYGEKYFLGDIRMPATPPVKAFPSRAEKEAARGVNVAGMATIGIAALPEGGAE
jgi:hypothetical protein